MAVALRSFCHFLFLRGDTARDLDESVPSVRKWRQSTVPTFLTPEQQEALIASADRSTPTGRRDYAILLLLARLGLRAGEIVAMQLDDFHWRSGELVVHGKGQMVEHVPLPSSDCCSDLRPSRRYVVAEQVHRGTYSFVDWHLALVWRDRQRLARLFVRPSHVQVSAPRAVVCLNSRQPISTRTVRENGRERRQPPSPGSALLHPAPARAARSEFAYGGKLP